MSWAFRLFRPLEWAVLLFIGYVFARGGAVAFSQWRELAGLRTAVVFFALGLVSVFAMARRYARTRWPEGSADSQRLLWGIFPIALFPLLFASYFALTNASLRAQLARLPWQSAMPVVAHVGFYALGFGLPSMVLWFALGLHLKAFGALVGRRFLLEGGRDLALALREWTPLLLTLSAYAFMGAVIGSHVGPGRDGWILAADRALFFGRDPQDLIQGLIRGPLSEWFAFSYSFYALLYPLVFGAALMFGGKRVLRETAFAVGAALLMAYVSYTLIPVKGPLLSRHFVVPLDLYYIGEIKQAMMDNTRITYDCFPSMHTCCTVLLTWGAFRSARKLFWCVLPMAASIPFACVYLRYHYVTDVLAGLVLAVGMICLTNALRTTLASGDGPEGLEFDGGR